MSPGSGMGKTVATDVNIRYIYTYIYDIYTYQIIYNIYYQIYISSITYPRAVLEISRTVYERAMRRHCLTTPRPSNDPLWLCNPHERAASLKFKYKASG